MTNFISFQTELSNHCCQQCSTPDINTCGAVISRYGKTSKIKRRLNCPHLSVLSVIINIYHFDLFWFSNFILFVHKRDSINFCFIFEGFPISDDSSIWSENRVNHSGILTHNNNREVKNKCEKLKSSSVDPFCSIWVENKSWYWYHSYAAEHLCNVRLELVIIVNRGTDDEIELSVVNNNNNVTHDMMMLLRSWVSQWSTQSRDSQT